MLNKGIFGYKYCNRVRKFNNTKDVRFVSSCWFCIHWKAICRYHQVLLKSIYTFTASHYILVSGVWNLNFKSLFYCSLQSKILAPRISCFDAEDHFQEEEKVIPVSSLGIYIYTLISGAYRIFWWMEMLTNRKKFL